jgi:elongation factor G
MLEVLAECDDTLMEKYFEDPSTITEDEIVNAIRKGTIAMQINPMICGSSFKNKGVQTLLDAVCAYLPSPADTPAIEGTDPDDSSEKTIVRHPTDEPLCALAFKIATDPYVGRLCFFRVYSGELPAGSYVYNTRSGKKERISRLFQMHSNKQNPKDVIGCGDIGAGVGFKDIRTGDTLCDENNLISWNQWISLNQLSVSLLSQKLRKIWINWVWDWLNWPKKILHSVFKQRRNRSDCN